MNKFFKRSLCLLFALVALCCVFSLSSFAVNDGWTYANSLPKNITSDKYTIQYNNVYRKQAASSPGSDWKKLDYAYSVYENSGKPYQSAIELLTSSTRELVSYYYYHYCSGSTGITVNYEATSAFTHYDAISGYYTVAKTYTDDTDSRYKSYALKYSNGNYVYCSSGFSCDGKWGAHSGRSYLWYKMCTYQDKKKVDYYNFEKSSGWTSKKDTSAVSSTVRYKLKHTHSYSSWKVTKKATLTENGSRYRICNGCKAKQTSSIQKISSIKLSKTTYTYNGKVQTPSVTVKDAKGNTISSKNYSVSYSKGRKNIGSYKVAIKFKGSYYSGSKTLSYKIVPQKPAKISATPSKNAITLKWSAVSGGVQYKIYSYNPSNKKYTGVTTTTKTSYKITSLSSGKKYYYVVKAAKKVGNTTYTSSLTSRVGTQPYGAPAQVKSLAVSSKTHSAVALKWNKASGNNVKYYIYQYNPSSKTYKKLASTTDTKYTVKSLKEKTTYYFMVRAYSNAGEGYFGAKSSHLKVTTNKYVPHFLTNAINKGDCRTLTGDVAITILLVNDPVTKWDSESLKTFKSEVSTATTKLKEQAKEYNVSLNLSVKYITCTSKYNTPNITEDSTNWRESALKSAKLPTSDKVTETLKKEYSAKEVPVIFATNQDGRSYANVCTSSKGFEAAMIYKNQADYRHELLHLFGAKDYYYPKKLTELIKKYYKTSIMLGTYGDDIDNLTAYTVGWTKKLSSASNTIIKETANITQAQIEKELAEQTVTGYVTNKEIYDDGSRYTGYMVAGVLHGQGTITYANGNTLSGTFENGLLNGYGTYTMSGGGGYVGNFKDSIINGYGTFTYSNGDVYTGNFVNDNRHGYGTYTWTNGVKYVGYWENGQQTTGTYYNANGSVIRAARSYGMRPVAA